MKAAASAAFGGRTGKVEATAEGTGFRIAAAGFSSSPIGRSRGAQLRRWFRIHGHELVRRTTECIHATQNGSGRAKIWHAKKIPTPNTGIGFNVRLGCHRTIAGPNFHFWSEICAQQGHTMTAATSLGLPNGIERDIDRWFVEEVLPLEGILTSLIRRNWRDPDEVADICQEVYLRVYESAAVERPDSTRAYVLSAARNLLIDKARRAQVVSIESVADLDSLDLSSHDLTPERYASARGEMRLLQNALHELPPRCRQVIEMRKISGMSQRDISTELGVTEHTVEKQVSVGLRKLANALFAHDIHFDVPIFRAQRKKKRDGT